MGGSQMFFKVGHPKFMSDQIF